MKKRSLKEILKKEKFRIVSDALKFIHNEGYDLWDEEVIVEVKNHFGCSRRNVTNKRRLIFKQGFEKTIEEKGVFSLKPKHTVEGGIYTILSSRGNITLPVEEVDKIFYHYSSHGLDKTGTQIINDFNFEVWEWNAIKNSLDIYKKSNIFSPHTLENLTQEQREALINDKIAEALTDKLNIENLYNKTVIRKRKKAIAEQNQRELFFQSLELGLEEIKHTFTHKTVVTSLNLNATHKPVAVFIADIHAGAKTKNLKNTDPFSFEILKEKLFNIAEEVNNLNAVEVNYIFLGDMIESFTGLNHINTWQELDEDMYGMKVVQSLVEVLVEMFSRTNNLNAVYALGGNHDRGDSNNKIDYKGEIAGIVFGWVSSHFKKLKIHFDFDIVNPLIDDIKYVCLHGHNKEVGSASDLVLNYGDQTKYNLIVSGHLHSLKILKDFRNYRHIVCPSVFPGNRYSERAGWSSNSGFMIAYNNGKGKPNLNIYSI